MVMKDTGLIEKEIIRLGCMSNTKKPSIQPNQKNSDAFANGSKKWFGSSINPLVFMKTIYLTKDMGFFPRLSSYLKTTRKMHEIVLCNAKN